MTSQQPTSTGKEYEEFLDAVGVKDNSVLFLLRGHLLSENILERLLSTWLRRGDKVVQSGNLSYYQKLVLVDSFGCVNDAVVQSLKNLNTVRNKLAHDLGKTISRSDVDLIGQPLGKEFRKLRHKAGKNDTITLHSIIAYLCGYLTGILKKSEENEDTDQ